MEMITVINAHDGTKVAGYLSGYLNCRPCAGHEDFCRVMETFPRQRHNFLLLSLLWFNHLRKVENPTAEFEASVALAKSVNEKMGGIKDAKLLREMQITAVPNNFVNVVDGVHEIDTAIVMSRFLSRKNDAGRDYKSFILTMGEDHRTIQQSFTRLIMSWCRWLDSRYAAGSKHQTALLARTIYSCHRALPYI